MSVLVTTTLRAPAVPEGVVQVIEVDEMTVRAVQALPPIVTVALGILSKRVPVIVTDVPPGTGPLVGLIKVTVGAWAA